MQNKNIDHIPIQYGKFYDMAMQPVNKPVFIYRPKNLNAFMT